MNNKRVPPSVAQFAVSERAELLARIAEQAREIDALRRIISECATACGAAVSVECSLELMAMLPDEIRTVMTGKSRIVELEAEVRRWVIRIQQRGLEMDDLREELKVAHTNISELDALVLSLQCKVIERDAELAAIKAQGVVMPEPMKRGDEGGSGEYGAAMIRGYNACLREVARLNAAPVSSGDPEKCSYQDDPRSPAELSLAGCNCVRFGECNPHWPCKLHTPAADAGIVDMYRHLQKVTPYRFKKIQDASITDGGDVMYFHKDRFDAALLADMAAHCAAKGVV